MIDKLLKKMNKPNKDIDVTSRSKPTRHRQPKVENLHATMVQMYGGVNLSTIAGINDNTMLQLLAEVGNDMSRFPTKKHFVSWCDLSPKNKQSGKMKKRVKDSSNNKVGLIFRISAQSLAASKHNAIGIFINRLKGRKGSKVAIKAGARKIAEAFYDALTKGMDYVEQGAEKYKEQLQQREIYVLHKIAKKYNMKVT